MLSAELVVTMSSRPSPFKSATADGRRRSHRRRRSLPARRCRRHCPVARSTVPWSRLVSMRSGLPSPLTSATRRGILVRAQLQDRLGLERAVAIAQQHADRASAFVGGDNVELAVAVQVRHRDRRRARSDREGLLRREGAVPVAQQHADRVVAVVGGDDVLFAVAGQVRHSHAARVVSNRVGFRGLEGAVPVAQQHAHAVRAAVGHNEVGDAVAGQGPPPPPHRPSLCSLPPRMSFAGWKVPSPLPSSTLTVPL